MKHEQGYDVQEQHGEKLVFEEDDDGSSKLPARKRRGDKKRKTSGRHPSRKRVVHRR